MRVIERWHGVLEGLGGGESYREMARSVGRGVGGESYREMALSVG